MSSDDRKNFDIDQALRQIEDDMTSRNSSFYRPPRTLSQSVLAAASQSSVRPISSIHESGAYLYHKPRVVLKVMDSPTSSVICNHAELQSSSAFFSAVSRNELPGISVQGMSSNASIQKVIQNDMDAARRMKMKERGRKRKFVRSAGGEVWEDETLQDWDPDDFRLFCGDLGNEVNDDTLSNAFKRYPSFQRAKVIRDKRTGKTRGFGFVSFHDSQDFIKAMREVNGKYVGNRPIKLRKSNWRDRNIEVVKKKEKEKAIFITRR
ncbi:hypothetical protein ACOME3_000342 [Neoechinorhynchus agilis]